MQTLLDLGERRLISELLNERYAKNTWRFGDDTALVVDTRQHPGGLVVATTDPGPTPVIAALGDTDPYHHGWLTAALNLSDLAAAGASAAGLLISLILPNMMSVADFGRLLDGFDDCCASVSTHVLGGNLKEGPAIHCEATAIGVVDGDEPLSRSGARPGDIICALGATGDFWAAILTYGHDILPLTEAERKRLHTALTMPQPRIDLGLALRRDGLVSACTDNSDGMYGAFWCLAQGSGIGIRFEPDRLELDPLVTRVAQAAGRDPVRLVLGFGDLQLVCAVPPDRLERVRELCRQLETGFTPVGTAVEQRGLFVSVGDSTHVMSNFDNERFTVSSQFTAGLDGYGKRLFEQSLSTGEDWDLLQGGAEF